MVGFELSERRACGLLELGRSTMRYEAVEKSDDALRIRLRDLASVHVRYGCPRLYVLLRREGWPVNHKKVYRLYKEEGLSLRLKKRKKRVSQARVIRSKATAPNQHWSMDFMVDSLFDGRRFRLLTIVDNFTRECPAIEVDFSLTGKRVVAVLERLAALRGVPLAIWVDNGPEFISKALDGWAYSQGVKLDFSRPGTPTDNPYIESFNGKFRAECLDQHWFISKEDARGIIEQWRQSYNKVRPHRSLGQLTPAEFARCWTNRSAPELVEF